jgi:hypothetical protein
MLVYLHIMYGGFHFTVTILFMNLKYLPALTCYKKRLTGLSPSICPYIGTIDQTDCYQIPAHHQIQPFFQLVQGYLFISH